MSIALLIEYNYTIQIDDREYRSTRRTFECWRRTLNWLWQRGEAEASLFQGGVAYKLTGTATQYADSVDAAF